MSDSLTEKRAETNQITGKSGEDAACTFLESQGYRVLFRNFRAGRDEIDIIASKDRYTVFVEVKTRTEKKYMPHGRPANAVGADKRRNLARAAERYIKMNRSDCFYRFDIVEVLICSDPKTGEGSYKFNHMKGVFGARGKIWI